MPTKTQFGRIAIAVMAVPVLCAGSKVSSAPDTAALAMHAALQIKPGLWEFIDTPKVTGDTVISDVMMANMPAAQREQFVAETRKLIAQRQTVRECISQAKFDQRLFSDVRSDCTVSVISNTVSRIEVHTVCRGEGGGIRQDTDHNVVASSPTSVASSMHAVVMRERKTMTVDTTEKGRWLSTDCGGVKGIQVMP
jgi:hypothetical protein